MDHLGAQRLPLAAPGTASERIATQRMDTWQRLAPREAGTARASARAIPPPFAVAPEKNGVGKAVTGGMLAEDAIPATVDHGHTCVGADGLECDLDLGVLAGPERRLAPTEDKPLTWPPDPNAADPEDGAAGQCFDEAPALTGLEGEFAGRAGCEPEQCVGYPPDPDVTREYLEGARGRRLDAQRYKNLRRQDTRST